MSAISGSQSSSWTGFWPNANASMCNDLFWIPADVCGRTRGSACVKARGTAAFLFGLDGCQFCRPKSNLQIHLDLSRLPNATGYMNLCMPQRLCHNSCVPTKTTFKSSHMLVPWSVYVQPMFSFGSQISFCHVLVSQKTAFFSFFEFLADQRAVGFRF